PHAVPPGRAPRRVAVVVEGPFCHRVVAPNPRLALSGPVPGELDVVRPGELHPVAVALVEEPPVGVVDHRRPRRAVAVADCRSEVAGADGYAQPRSGLGAPNVAFRVSLDGHLNLPGGSKTVSEGRRPPQVGSLADRPAEGEHHDCAVVLQTGEALCLAASQPVQVRLACRLYVLAEGGGRLHAGPDPGRGRAGLVRGERPDGVGGRLGPGR